MIEPDELARLWRAHRAGDRRSRDLLVEEYMWLARRIAWSHRVPDHIERDELVSWASMGLLQAVERFNVEGSDGAFHRHFMAYASTRIRGSILDGLKSPQFSWAPRAAWRAIKEQRAAEDALSQVLGRGPTRKELAEHLGVKQSELLQLQQQIPVGATNEQGEQHGLELIAGLDAPDQEAALVALAERVATCVARLPGRLQVVLHEVVVGGKSLGATAKILGATIPEVRALREEAQVALRMALQAE